VYFFIALKIIEISKIKGQSFNTVKMTGIKATLLLVLVSAYPAAAQESSYEQTTWETTTTMTYDSSTVPSYLCAADISAQCPVPDVGNAVMLPDPEDCSKYCQCSNGVAYAFDCAPGSLFDVVDVRCETASDVDCGTRPRPSTIAPTGTSATTISE